MNKDFFSKKMSRRAVLASLGAAGMASATSALLPNLPVAHAAGGSDVDGIDAASYNILPDGSDQSAKLIALLNDSTVYGHPIYFQAGTYVFSQQITIKPEHHSLIGVGNVIFDFTSIPAGASSTAIYFNGNPSNLNDSPMLISKNKMCGITVKGNHGIGIKMEHATNYNCNFVFERCTFDGFDENVRMSSNSFCNLFLHCIFRTSQGTNFKVVSGGTNYGERITLISCFMYNSNIGVVNEYGSCDIYLIGCSIDYHKQMLKCTGGTITFIGGHLESPYDQNYWLEATGSGSTIYVGGGTYIAYRTDGPAFGFGYCDESVKLGGIVLDGVFIGGLANSSSMSCLIRGEGRVRANHVSQLEFDKKFPIAWSLNELADGYFNSTDALAEWTVTGGAVAPTIDTSTFYQGTGSLRLKTNVVSQKCEISKTFPLKPGQLPAISFYMKSQGLSPSYPFTLQIQYLNAQGVVIRTENKTYNSDSAAFLLRQVYVSYHARPGTDRLKITLSTGQRSSVNDTVWIDQLLINILS